MCSRLQAVYHVRGDAQSIDARAHALAVEQSVEMPLSAITDDFVLSEIVGQVSGIREIEVGKFEVRIDLAAATMEADPGQLINMLFGNSSLQDDVVLHDVEFLPDALVARLGGPRHGVSSWREGVDAGPRALTCSALKPQGLPPARLAELAQKFASGGIDYVKDDHGLADQAYSPFAERVEAISAALANMQTRYLPSLSGDLDALRQQVSVARKFGIEAVMVAPMIVGLANFHRLVLDNPDIAFMAHPSLGGAARIAPPLLIGKLFRLLGADAVIFPNHGGRFGYSPETCRGIADAARSPWHGLRAAMPVPAGGMTRERVPEMLDFYRADIMLLIGGALLQARERLAEETAAFVAEVRSFDHG